VNFDEKIQELVNFDFIPVGLIFESMNLAKPENEQGDQLEQDDLDEESDSLDRRLES
jgi:hypothetical protein